MGQMLNRFVCFTTQRTQHSAQVPSGGEVGIEQACPVEQGNAAIDIAMLSGSTSESGTDDMMAAILLRGLGLGFLFLSITLIAFSDLNSRNLACEIGLFNTGRQLGGLMGVAGL